MVEYKDIYVGETAELVAALDDGWEVLPDIKVTEGHLLLSRRITPDRLADIRYKIAKGKEAVAKYELEETIKDVLRKYGVKLKY